jgi:predicted component of type VI protein secretion system
MNNARKALASIEKPMQSREKWRRTIKKLMDNARKSLKILKTMENGGKTLEHYYRR